MTIIFSENGKTYSVQIPYHLGAITFESFCEFKRYEVQFLNMDKTKEERLAAYTKALGMICPGDIEVIQTVIPGEEVKQLIDSKYMIPIEAGHIITKDRIYAHIVTLIQNYMTTDIPTLFKFNWHGLSFEVEQGPAARVLMKKPLSAGEALETMEFQRKASINLDNSPELIGNIDFNLGLTEFAILVKKKNELLPSSRSKRKKFLEERTNLFKSLPLDVVMNLRFFFMNALLKYGTTQPTNYSGKVLRVRGVQANKRMQKGRGRLLLKKPGK